MTSASDLRSGKTHRDENFPVASWIIHPRHRALILAFYNFVRTADDIADHADLPGGMGLRFDWKLLDGHDQRGAWGLSGGLDAANVADAIRITRTPLVDVSSGVERAPGVKDVDKIAAFCQAVRAF